MKRIAFFVEGQTEQIFINKLLIEIAVQRNISVELKQLRRGAEISINQSIFYLEPQEPLFKALIFDCGSDEKVKQTILDRINGLAQKGYYEVVGLRDLRPKELTELEKYTKEWNKKILPQYLPLPIPFRIIIAVQEIEAWFLAECSHFEKIDKRLTNFVIQNQFEFNPCLDDMRLRTNPAKDLNQIYQYSKKKKQVERTVNCLDYKRLYLEIKNKIPELDELIQKIDNFLK